MKRKVVYISIGLIVLVAAIFFFIRTIGGQNRSVVYETALVSYNDVKIAITATGTIQAIQTVEVGTQVSGKISKIYADFNSQVKAGQLLAELDRKPLQTSVTIAEASLQNAKAEVTFQAANFNRIKALSDKKLTSSSSYDEALYNLERANATLKTAQLTYDQAKINLEYSFIYSPIDGVVMDRAVNEGQTVAASFNTPTLFTIAHDLTQMQVEASIDEADIGNVKMGQNVTFTVDAFPDDTFKGEITQIRLKPITTSNVVTYTVIVNAPNPDLKLMPGMTANLNCYVDEANHVLSMPSQALQFVPDSTLKSLPLPPDLNGKQVKSVWVKTGKTIHPVFVEIGLNDDLLVEIKSGLKLGDEIVLSATGEIVGTGGVSKENNTGSPFMPKPPTRKSNAMPPPPGG